MQTLKDLKQDDLKDKKVLLRVDFNVPVVNDKIQEDYKIKAQKETIDFLLRAGAKILLISHHSTDGFSFADIIDQIEDILDAKILFVKNLDQIKILDKLESGTIVLMDNIRQYNEEKKNDPDFAKSLSVGFDFYINDAFSVSHRAHASLSAITKFLPSYAGFLLNKEIEQLSEVIESPANGKILIIGGGKVDTKVSLVKNFLDPSISLEVGKADKILIGGAVANNFFKAKGFEIGKSIFDENYIDELTPLLKNSALFLPEDVIISPDRIGNVEASPFPAGNINAAYYILDIGPETAKHFSDLIKNSEMVIWNGPMGMFEIDAFSSGTKEIVEAVSRTKAYTVIGGGDTISAFNKFGDLNNVDFISTGGGAMLEFLSGKKLPGLEALN